MTIDTNDEYFVDVIGIDNSTFQESIYINHDKTLPKCKNSFKSTKNLQNLQNCHRCGCYLSKGLAINATNANSNFTFCSAACINEYKQIYSDNFKLLSCPVCRKKSFHPL